MDQTIYTIPAMAAHLGVTLRTMENWAASPAGAFIQVGSCACLRKEARWTYVASLDGLPGLVRIQTRGGRRHAARCRWDVSAGDNVHVASLSQRLAGSH
jgi:hypothetical protein